jgi:hypothetical protein
MEEAGASIFRVEELEMEQHKNIETSLPDNSGITPQEIIISVLTALRISDLMCCYIICHE